MPIDPRMAKWLAVCLTTITLAACGAGPTLPPYDDAFKGIYRQSSATVPGDVPVTVRPPVGIILSDNVETYINWVKQSNAYWGKVIPASLTNEVAIADSNPNYIAAQVLDMLKRHFPDAQVVKDFNEAVASGKHAVCLVDIRAIHGASSFKTTTIDIVAYFFDASMNPVSKMSGHGEAVVPYPATTARVQPSTDAAVQQLDAKIRTLVH